MVFGHEQSGLSNDHLALSHIHLKIPTADHFSSLNLAAAVQVVVYELFLKNLGSSTVQTEKRTDLATQEELHRFYQELEKTLFDIRFLSPQHPDLLLRRLRRLFNRAEMDKNELNILYGVLSSINRRS